MTIDQLAEQIGLLSDRADNYASAAQLPMPPEIHIRMLAEGMATMRDEMRKLHVKATGENPWEEPTPRPTDNQREK